MNHCLIQAVINSAPQMRYTKDNKTPIAEMIVNFKGLRDQDPSRELKVLGWGTIPLLILGIVRFFFRRITNFFFESICFLFLGSNFSDWCYAMDS